MDVVADTYVMRQKESPLPELYRHIRERRMDEAIHALYQKIWGVDLGIEGHESVSRRLSRIPYLERQRWRESIRRFSKVVQPLLEGGGGPEGANDDNPMGNHELQQYSPQEVEKGLQGPRP